jgi:hypothetical protein
MASKLAEHLYPPHLPQMVQSLTELHKQSDPLASGQTHVQLSRLATNLAPRESTKTVPLVGTRFSWELRPSPKPNALDAGRTKSGPSASHIRRFGSSPKTQELARATLSRRRSHRCHATSEPRCDSVLSPLSSGAHGLTTDSLGYGASLGTLSSCGVSGEGSSTSCI